MRRAVLTFAGSILLIAATGCSENGAESSHEASKVASTSIPPVQSDRFVALNKVLEFRDGAEGVAFLESGWMPPEGWGAWTAKPTEPGIVSLPVDPSEPPRLIRIKFWGQLGPGLPSEEFRLVLAGSIPVRLRVDEAQPIVETEVPIDASAKDEMLRTGRLRIEIFAPDGKSPKAMGLNTDERVLGFGIREITLM